MQELRIQIARSLVLRRKVCSGCAIEEKGETTTVSRREGNCVENQEVADIVLSYGKKGVIAQSVYGIGPQMGLPRVLSKMHDSEEEFYEDLLEANTQIHRDEKILELEMSEEFEMRFCDRWTTRTKNFIVNFENVRNPRGYANFKCEKCGRQRRMRLLRSERRIILLTLHAILLKVVMDQSVYVRHSIESLVGGRRAGGRALLAW